MSEGPITALSQLFEELPLGMAWVAADGKVLSANGAAQSLLNGAASEPIRDAIAQLCQKAQGESIVVEHVLSLGALGEIRLMLSRGSDGRLIAIERSSISRLRAELGVLRTLIASAVEALPPAKAIERALGTLAASLAGSQITLYQLDDTRTKLVALGANRGLPALAARVPTDLGGASSGVARAMLFSQPVHVANLARSPFPADRLVPGADKLVALAIPVRSSGETIGVIDVCGPSGMLSEGELRLVQGLADIVGALLDRARREAAAVAERSARQAALDSLDDAFLEMDADGRIVLLAGRASEVFGLPPALVIGRKIDEWLHPGDDELFRELMDKARRLGHASGEIQLAGVGRARLPCVISVGVSHVGTEIVVRALVRDISGKLALEADLRRARDGAAQQDNLARIGRLAAGVAHEINNPLSYVMVNVHELRGALKRELEGDAGDGYRWTTEQLLGMASEAVEGIERINGIVRALNGVARSRPDDDLAFDPARAVRDAVTVFRGARKTESQISFETPELPMVRGSPAALGQIMLNLLSNGLDAMGEKGSIRVQATTDGESVFVSVADSGPGIPAAVRERLFEPFFTTKAVGKGTGLGLYICQELATRLRGRLDLETGAEGTTFTIVLPAVVTKPAASRPPASAAPAAN